MTIGSGKQSSALLLTTTVAGIVAVCALLAMIGADTRWLAALGHVIASRGQIPHGVPFAAAPSGHWANALVLAELAFNALSQALGDRGLMLAQLVAVAVAMGVLAKDALAGGADAPGASRALMVATLGALPSLVIVRVQLFSIALFPIVMLLLRADARRPSWRIWLVIPLLALWSNLHGVALLGLGVVLAYAVLVKLRRQPLVACGLALAAPAALLLTPALLATTDYYHGLLTNTAAQRGQGMWGPLSLTSPFDLILIATAIALAVWWRRTRPAPWEVVIAIALAALTVHADRDGLWLLLFLAPQAARARRGAAPAWLKFVPAVGLAAVVVLCVALVRGPVPRGADPQLLARAITLAHGRPVLANDGIDEQVALAGGRIWAGNPIDAFTRRTQGQYLDFIAGTKAGAGALAGDVGVVLVSRGSAAQRLTAHTPGFTLVESDGAASLYVRREALAATPPPS
jgi:hypothetical protein